MPVMKREIRLSSLPCLASGPNSFVYRLDDSGYGAPAVIKISAREHADFREHERLLNEYRVTGDLNVAGIRRAFDYVTIEGKPALVLEYIEGATVREGWVRQRRQLAEMLAAAAAVAAAVHAVHRHDIVHRNISAMNVIVGPDGRATVIDFDMAVRSGTAAVGEGTIPSESLLQYISPEQTGRMNRPVDYRTDLYSLGVVLYEIFSARLPFEAPRPSELVYMIIAKRPVPVNEIDPAVPQAVSDIVMKLLAKNAGDRYQSAYGVRRDLENCLGQLKEKGRIEPFPPGREDYPGKLVIPPTLYGREQEEELLTAAVGRVSGGAGETVLVTGNAGAGKSALVAALRQPVTDRDGCFLTGKHDIYRQNTPYYALAQAFTGLVDLLLIESGEALAQWKNALLEAVGNNGALLLEVIPKLALVIGAQPPAPEPGPGERQIRFQHTFQNFVRAVARKRHPLVLFIDNLQWSDIATPGLLKFLFTGIGIPQVLFVGACRDAEIAVSHPVQELLEAAERPGTGVSRIPVKNLTPDALNAMVAAALRCPLSYARALSDLIYGKTGGNALFAVQLLQSLYDEKLLFFDFDAHQWVWDTGQIRALSVTDNVIVLMTQRIEKLPRETQELLSAAACMGTTFSLSDLSDVTGQPSSTVLGRLQKAVAEGLLVPLDNSAGGPAVRRLSFEFLHDRVRQAAYSFIPRRQRRTIHLKTGRLLLRKMRETELEEKIFVVADHLNEGFPYITEEQERLRLVELNLLAGRKAKREAAYKTAIWYFSMGTGMLPPDRWERHYHLSLQLYLEAVEAEYLSANFDRANLLSADVLRHAKDPAARIRVYEFKVMFYAAQNRVVDALREGFAALKMLDVHLPEAPAERKAFTEQLQTELASGIGRIEDLVHLPSMQDEHQLAVMRILMNMTTPAYQTDHELLTMIVSYMVLLSVRKGNSPIAAFAYGWYGVLLCGVLDDIEKGYRYGQLSLGMLRQFNAAGLETRVTFLYNVFVRHWKEDAREVLKPLQALSQSGIASGDPGYAGYSAAHYCGYLFWTGGNLEYVGRQQEELRQNVDRYQLEFQSQLLRIWGQTVLNLQGRSIVADRLQGELLDETALLPLWLEQNRQVRVFCVCLCRLMLHYLFGNYAAAVESGRQGEHYERGGRGYLYSVEFNFFYALALLAVSRTADRVVRGELLKKVRAIQERLQRWAHYAPVNYRHKYDLVEAERAQVEGETLTALERYDAAVKGARENGRVQDESLAHEREGEFLLALGREDFAGLELRKAVEGYRFWGARRKADELEQTYRYLLEREKPPSMDTAAIMQSLHALSQELRLDRLLDRLMRIVMENAGAERGVLLEYREGRLFVQAKRTIGIEQVATMRKVPVEESGEAAVSVVNYVARTRTPVVLNDAFHDLTYGGDRYIATRRTKSLLCLPIMHQSRLLGILYLENNLATNVFTPERLELLKALSAQAAISMENAGLYAHLEDTIRELRQTEDSLRRYTAELARSNAELERFAYVASHDLQEPLRMVTSFVELLAKRYRGKLDADANEFIGYIVGGTNRMSQLINDLLAYSRVSTRGKPLEPVNLEEVFVEALNNLRLTIGETGAQVTHDLFPVVKADRSQMLQLLQNLLDNAVKFRKPTEPPRIHAGVARKENEWLFSIRDNGIGIEPQYFERIFVIFQRLHGREQYKGTGIGLAICKRIVERHKGRIWVESEPGKGSTFYFTLPA